MTFADRFGGNGLQPSDVSLAQYELSDQALVTYWPSFADSTNVLAAIIEVISHGPAETIRMPDASLGSPGTTTIFRNIGTNSFVVADFSGTTLYTVTPGQVISVYLTDNTTRPGAWGAFILGAGVASLDLANAAGNGLFVFGSKLNVSPISSATSGDRTIGEGDVATAFVWTGGAGTFTLPLSISLGEFFIEVRNQGSGALVLATTGGELIDSSASLSLSIGESCFVHAGTGFWYTVGRGRATQFSFTQLQKTVTGGTTTLTLTEAANVVQTYIGTLTQNEDVVVPSVVQVYYVSNQTSGAFNFRVKTQGIGTTVSLPTGQNAVLFCDGTNVINASTTISGLSNLILASGSAVSPSIGVGATNTGIFSSGSNLVSFSSNSVKVAEFNTTGLVINAPGPILSINAPSGSATINLVRTPGNYAVTNYYNGGSIRWTAGMDNSAEPGSNVGSNFFISSFKDDTSALFTPFSINRSTGLVTIPSLAATTITGNLSGNASTASTAASATNATNASHASSATQLDGGFTPVSFMQRGTGNGFTCYWNGSILYFGVDGNVFGGTMPMHISGNAATASLAANASLINGIGPWRYQNLAFNPAYIWATNGAAADNFLVQPGNLNVNFANSADVCNLSNNTNALGGAAPGFFINNGGTAVINIRNSGISSFFSALSGFGDVFWGVNVSDITLKKNIESAEVDSTDDIDRLEFISFEFNNDLHELEIDDGGRHTLGIGAQQAKSVRAEWIETRGKYLQPKVYEMLMSTMHSLQKANRRIASLEERISALEDAK